MLSMAFTKPVPMATHPHNHGGAERLAMKKEESKNAPEAKPESALEIKDETKEEETPEAKPEETKEEE